MTMPRRSCQRRRRAACCAALFACATAGAQAPDTLTVPMPPPQVRQAILRAVQQLPLQQEQHRRYRMALPFGAALFPPDTDFAAPPVAPALAAWLALPAAQRRYDLLITPDIDYYWNADGRLYSCQFLLHIEARGPGAQLSVLQLRPTEYAGKHFELLGRTGPGRYMTLLPASPSAQTGTELRAFLAAALAHRQ